MCSNKFKFILLLILFHLGIVSALMAQHYVFIEAERQQPFYIKRGNETYSSTISGFIILSKLTVKEVDFIIGFPHKLFPEVSFKVSGLDRDKGFLLKQDERKNWVLVDRSGAGMIAGGVVTQQILATATGTSSAGFADLLADATGDRSLLEKSLSSPAPVTKQVVVNNKAKPNSETNKNQQVTSKSKSWGTVRSIVQSDDSTMLRITYFEKNAKENWDTILVEIEKPLVKISKINTEPVALLPSKIIVGQVTETADKKIDTSKFVVDNFNSSNCMKIIALPKDVRELQRRMTKASTIEEQIAIGMKAMGDRCFTTKQIKELGNVFLEEQNRLQFFSMAKKWVSDPALYSELEQAFLQENSKKAFRDMQKQQSP